MTSPPRSAAASNPGVSPNSGSVDDGEEGDAGVDGAVDDIDPPLPPRPPNLPLFTDSKSQSSISITLMQWASKLGHCSDWIVATTNDLVHQGGAI